MRCDVGGWLSTASLTVQLRRGMVQYAFANAPDAKLREGPPTAATGRCEKPSRRRALLRRESQLGADHAPRPQAVEADASLLASATGYGQDFALARSVAATGKGKGGVIYGHRTSCCLETQPLPDAMKYP